jgi:hypothetical protein
MPVQFIFSFLKQNSFFNPKQFILLSCIIKLNKNSNILTIFLNNIKKIKYQQIISYKKSFKSVD